MIEKIKKEILNNQYPATNNPDNEQTVIFTDTVLEILDKYNTQPDYKSAFDELNKKIAFYISENEKWNTYRFNHTTKFKIEVWKILAQDMQELSVKYNLDSEVK